jgi:hypothetical protein
MALNIPNNLYSEGAVVFDSQPLANMYHQYTMRAQARDEALDDYFRNLNKTINPAGVRNQDIEGLTKKQNEWTQFYQQNKNAIKNPRIDNGKAYAEYQSRLQDMHNYIAQSKNASAISEDMAKARLDPNKGFMFEDDEVITKIGEHDKPLTDPTHKTLNIQELSIQPKPIDVKEWQAMQKSAAAGLKPSEEVEGISVDPATFDTVTKVRKKYSPEDLQAAGNRMKSFYQLDERVRRSANKNLLNSPNAAELNEVYKSVYGKNAETPADLLAAQTIQGLQTEGTFEKRTPGSLEQKKFLERLKQSGRKELLGMRQQYKQMDKAQEGLWLDTYIGEMKRESELGPKGKYTYPTGQVVRESQIPVDALTAKALAREGSEPQAIRITDDGKIRPIFYQIKDKQFVKLPNGEYAVDEVLSQPISMNTFKLNLSKHTQTAKQRAAEMSGEPSSEKTTIKAEDYRSKYNY